MSEISMSLCSLLSALNVKTSLFSSLVSSGLHSVLSSVCALYDVRSCALTSHPHSFQAVRQYAEKMHHLFVCVSACLLLKSLGRKRGVCCEP